MVQDGQFFYWTKGETFSLSPHFTSVEFSCKCKHATCVNQQVSKELVRNLETLRNRYGSIINVHSGFRCGQYQADLKAAGYETADGISQHELGRAADVAGNQMATLLTQCLKLFMAVGSAKSFVHVDLRSDKVRFWTYT